jgi:hypothetical protein
MPAAPSFAILHPRLCQLFVQAFSYGHLNPQARPTAEAWAAALKEAEETLLTCTANSQHRFSNHLQSCPWCERAKKLGGRDPFPSHEAIKRGEHLKALPRKSTRVTPRKPTRTYHPTPPLHPATYMPPPLFQSHTLQQQPSRWDRFVQALSGLGLGRFLLLMLFVLPNLVRLLSCDPGYLDRAELKPPPPATSYGIESEAAFRERLGALVVSPDGKMIVNGHRDQQLKFWDFAYGGLVTSVGNQHGGAITSVAVSRDGKAVLTGSADRTLYFQPLRVNKDGFRLAGHEAAVTSVAFSPDGRTAISGSYDRTVKVWDISTGSEKHSFRAHTAPVLSVAFSPDGKTIASGGADGTVNLYYADKLSFKQALVSQPTAGANWTPTFTAVAFSPDGKLLAGASSDKIVLLWHVKTTEVKQMLVSREQEFALCLAFSPDGKLLATGNTDGRLHFWSMVSGDLLLSYRAHSQAIHSVAFTPDSLALASLGGDQMIYLWDMMSGEAKQKFISTRDLPPTDPALKLN